MTTTHLNLPELTASQSQKHVTHNEALFYLDTVVQLAVADKDLTSPPGSPVEGDRYIVGGSATGDWTGKDDQIAVYDGDGWVFMTPKDGWQAKVIDEGTVYIFTTSWAPLLDSLFSPPVSLTGPVSITRHPKFSAYRNSAQTIAANSWTTVVFNTTNHNTQGDYNVSTGVFTAPHNGIYAFDTSFRIDNLGVTPPAYIMVGFSVNGGSVPDYTKGYVSEGSATLDTLSFVHSSALLSLNAADTVEVRTWFSTDGGDIRANFNHFHGFQIP